MKMNERPPQYFGRNDLETLMASPHVHGNVHFFFLKSLLPLLLTNFNIQLLMCSCVHVCVCVCVCEPKIGLRSARCFWVQCLKASLLRQSTNPTPTALKAKNKKNKKKTKNKKKHTHMCAAS